MPIAFARLYLGVHWLTDTLAGLCLGLIWVTVLGIAYNRHPKAAVQWRGLLAYSVITLLTTGLLHVGSDYGADLQRYQPKNDAAGTDWRAMVDGGWRELPSSDWISRATVDRTWCCNGPAAARNWNRDCGQRAGSRPPTWICAACCCG